MQEPEILVKIGERIKEIRLKKNMSQNDLAMECNFEKASMSRIESGQTNPTVRTLSRICNALDIPLVDLFTEQE